MSESREKGAVFLLPNTVDYYQIQLTRLLETEQYQQAASLLHFLLQCESPDPQTHEEWQTLLAWLESLLNADDGSIRAASTAGEKEEEEETEEHLLRSRLKAKASEDAGYTEQLMAKLKGNHALDKQLLALEQLAYMDHPGINDTLKNWLELQEVNPLVQFKVLQILKARGYEGIIHLQRNEQRISLDVQDTPLSIDDFPPQASGIKNRVQIMNEQEQPDFIQFAVQTWTEFLSFIYGTHDYELLLSADEKGMDMWASALHFLLEKTLYGSADSQEIMDTYGITSDMYRHWDRAVHILETFTKEVFIEIR
ncbi:MAG: hypothetical protein A2189_03725 [Paenibacillus sp. RIFOXYA1_FULL_44_5]|nr:MAG: hypothetical protein A2189_03725 [Paenibacillus sp. RIFOXYA1_FULL_44_5]